MLSRRKLLGMFVLVLSLVPMGVNLVSVESYRPTRFLIRVQIQYHYDLSGQYIPQLGCIWTADMTKAVTIRSVYQHLDQYRIR